MSPEEVYDHVTMSDDSGGQCMPCKSSKPGIVAAAFECWTGAEMYGIVRNRAQEASGSRGFVPKASTRYRDTVGEELCIPRRDCERPLITQLHSLLQLIKIRRALPSRLYGHRVRACCLHIPCQHRIHVRLCLQHPATTALLERSGIPLRET